MLGWAHIYSALYLTQGYCQIPLTPIFSRKKNSLFYCVWVTPLWHPSVWVVWSPSAFQQLMDRFSYLSVYITAYLSDIINCKDWQWHLQNLRAVVSQQAQESVQWDW